jgi:hypothetical protein
MAFIVPLYSWYSADKKECFQKYLCLWNYNGYYSRLIASEHKNPFCNINNSDITDIINISEGNVFIYKR